jgi:RNA polymerase sigma factor (sigma-70 family)
MSAVVLTLPTSASSPARNLEALFDQIFSFQHEHESEEQGHNMIEEPTHTTEEEEVEDHPLESISDREVAVARKNPEFLCELWMRLQPSIKRRMKKVQRTQRHTQLDDLMQEAFEAFHKAIHAYDGRSSGAFVAYYRRYALHTKIRNFAAHDRVIPVPHDTRGARQSWHRISESTVQARVQAQELSWPDANPDQGWDTFQSEGEHMEDQVINSVDEENLRYKLTCLPRRWRDLLLLSQRYSNTRIAELTHMTVRDIEEIQTTAMNILRLFGKDRFWVGRSEAEYREEWENLMTSEG